MVTASNLHQPHLSHREAANSHSIIRDRRAQYAERNVSLVLNVAPRTKLGLGICKGPDWKPGIFVQFTKDRSVAREAGLRPGDQILSVNSIDFSDVLFSEAVAVMKSSNKLEMVVRMGEACELFPGESSGYNSSASSVTGDQSPCWAGAKSKRLSAVCEEALTTAPKLLPKQFAKALPQPDNSSTSCSELYLNVEDRIEISQNLNLTHEVNKTIIQLTENGTSINNTIVETRPHSAALNSNQDQLNCANSINSYLESNDGSYEAYAMDKQNTLQSTNSVRMDDMGSTISNMGNNTTAAPIKYNKTKEMKETDSNRDSGNSGNSSLSKAISEELKKRKEVRKITSYYQFNRAPCLK